MSHITIRKSAARETLTTPEGEVIELTEMSRDDANKARHIVKRLMKQKLSQQ